MKNFLIHYVKLQTAAKSNDHYWDGEGQKNMGAVIIVDWFTRQGTVILQRQHREHASITFSMEEKRAKVFKSHKTY